MDRYDRRRSVEVFVLQLSQRAAVYGVSELSPEALDIKAICASSDLFVRGKSNGDASVFDLGNYVTPEEIVETIIETEAKAVAMTTYNGIALSFAKELKEKMEKAGVSVLIILGGLLNENIDGESLATDVSDKLRELGVNADNDMAKIIPAVKEACDAEE